MAERQKKSAERETSIMPAAASSLASSCWLAARVAYLRPEG